MQRVEAIKNNLKSMIGKQVAIQEDCGRKKYEETKGTITNAYRGVFTVEVNFNRVSTGTVSYSYADVLCDKVRIQLLS